MISLVAAVTNITSHVVSCKELRNLNESCFIDADEVLMRADGFEFLNLNLNFFEFTNECRQLPMHLNF